MDTNKSNTQEVTAMPACHAQAMAVVKSVECTKCHFTVNVYARRAANGQQSRTGQCQNCGTWHCHRGHAMNSKAWSPSAGGRSIAFCRTGDCDTEYEAWTHEDTLKWRATANGKQAAKVAEHRRFQARTPTTTYEYAQGDYELAEPIVHVVPDSPEVTELRKFIDSLDN